jgi:hypothetical protein
MSRACSPGGRFTSDFEAQAISSAIDMDLKKPVGSSILLYFFDEVETDVDPIYDVGGSLPYDPSKGRIWQGPFTIPVVKAVISQGSTKISQAGFYNADTLHITINAKDIEKLVPGVMTNPDDQTRSRIVWKNQVYRPFNAQQRGIISEGFTLLTLECQQLMPEEMVNDPQFLTYSDDPL